MAPSSTKSRTDDSAGALQGSSSADRSKAVSDKASTHSGHKIPVTTYIAIAAGIFGGLILLMALSAYFRRWQRKRHLPMKIPADDDFVSKQEDPPDATVSSPTTTIASTINEEKRLVSPKWSHMPNIPPMPATYQQSTLRSDAGLASDIPDAQRLAPHMFLSGSSSHVRGSSAPLSIVTRGNSRTFSRSASELVFGKTSNNEPASPQNYVSQHRLSQVRLNSHSSNSYESLRPQSQMTNHNVQYS